MDTANTLVSYDISDSEKMETKAPEIRQPFAVDSIQQKTICDFPIWNCMPLKLNDSISFNVK